MVPPWTTGRKRATHRSPAVGPRRKRCGGSFDPRRTVRSPPRGRNRGHGLSRPTKRRPTHEATTHETPLPRSCPRRHPRPRPRPLPRPVRPPLRRAARPGRRPCGWPANRQLGRRAQRQLRDEGVVRTRPEPAHLPSRAPRIRAGVHGERLPARVPCRDRQRGRGPRAQAVEPGCEQGAADQGGQGVRAPGAGAARRHGQGRVRKPERARQAGDPGHRRTHGEAAARTLLSHREGRRADRRRQLRAGARWTARASSRPRSPRPTRR